MEIKINQIRKAKASYSGLAVARESAAITCVGQRPEGRQRSGNALGQKREGFRCALTAGHWPGATAGGPTRNGAYYGIG